jgi:hypothetical protein
MCPLMGQGYRSGAERVSETQKSLSGRVELSLYHCHDYVHDGAGVMSFGNLGRELLASH